MNTMTPVLIIIFIFTFIPLVFSEFARNRSLPTIADFYLQNRQMPFLLVFFTVYATWVSSFATIGATGTFFSHGPLYMTCFAWNIAFGLMFMIFGKRIWFHGKRNDLITPGDFFNFMYADKKLNRLISLMMIVFTIPYMMIQIYAGAIIIETATHGIIPWRVAGLIFSFIIIVYLWAGGLRAVAITDIFYGSMTFLTMLITGALLFPQNGGIKTIFLKAAEIDPDFPILSSPLSAEGALMWISMFVIIPIGALMGPSMWIRAYAAKNAAVFNKIPLYLALPAIMYLGPLFSAVSLKIISPVHAYNDSLIPETLMSILPPSVAAILLCGIASASLSTTNSQIHAISQIFTLDIYRAIRKHSTEYHLLCISKKNIILISSIVYIVILLVPLKIVETGIIGMAGTAQIFVAAVGALFWKKSNPTAAFCGIVAGTAFFLVASVFNRSYIPIWALIALIVNLLIFLALSLILAPRPELMKKIESEKRNYNKFFRF